MKHPFVMSIGMSAAVACVTGSAGAQQAAPVPEDTTVLLGRPVSDPLVGLPRGTYLSVVLARVRAGQRVRVEIPIQVEPPAVSPSAAAYASRYRISPDLAQTIIDAALAEGVDPELAFRLIRVESVFHVRARGPAGALGLTQLMPSTARSIDRSVRTEAQILEPATNLRLGFRYLRTMIRQYGGDVRLGLLAYNRGMTAVNRALRAGRDPENGYSHKVLGTRSGNPYRGAGLLSRSN